MKKKKEDGKGGRPIKAAPSKQALLTMVMQAEEESVNSSRKISMDDLRARMSVMQDAKSISQGRLL